ncbi:MAG: hypothetical protein ABIP48_11870 [Planctomycetota bacterium]
MITMLTALVAHGGRALGQSPWYEGFEGPETSWRAEGGDARFEVLAHRRVGDEAFTGSGCEHVAISAAQGTHVYLSHDVGQPRVIDELLPTVELKSDHAGLELLARIVLPRTKDPRTGQPLAALVQGSTYTTAGRWQQLRIDDLPQRLSRQTRILRAESGVAVDPREAYVDRLLLNVYGGPGATNVWIDDLDVGGHVRRQPAGAADRSEAEPVSTRPARARGATGVSPVPARASPAWGATGVSPVPGDHGQDTRATLTATEPGEAGGKVAPAARHIDIEGPLLMVDGRPMFPRIIQYQGEPLELLARLGFNTVWLAEPPSGQLLDEAAQSGLWVISPPPNPSQQTTPGAPEATPPPIGPRYERVLAWNLGRGLSTGELEATRQWAKEVRAADREATRPLVCEPKSELNKYSWHADLLMIGRSTLGGSLELADHGTWLRERPRLAQPGKPIWTTVQTQPAPGVLRQWAALGFPGAAGAAASYEQIRLLTYTAVAAGMRGLLFESHSPLDAPDVETRNRAMALELLNLELGLIEPWLAAGDFVTTIKGSEPEVIGGVLRSDRARLLVPIWSGKGAQFVPGQSAGNRISLLVPGVPEEYRAYLVAPGSLEPLDRKRETGGVRVTLDEFGLTSLVLLTGEPLVVGALEQRTSATGRRAARLERDLAAAKLHAVEHIHLQLSSRARETPEAAAWLGAAREGIQWSDGSLAARDYSAASRYARRAMRPLRLLERAHWQAAVESLPSPVAHPAAVSVATLPWYWSVAEQIASGQPGPNRLQAGDFESLETLLGAGWQHLQRTPPGIYAEAELASAAAHSGRYGLRLAAGLAEGDDRQVLVESPPSWITSPAVGVEAGELVRIHGWVRVPEEIKGNVDGLLVIDSLSGDALAERIGQTTGWREFTLFRVAGERGSMTVTFALSGIGQAWVDDVTVQPFPLRVPGTTHLDLSRRSGPAPP